MMRSDNRGPGELRRVEFDTHFTRWAEGSVLARFGRTHVLCNVTVEESLPNWLRNSSKSQGWLTAEYAMLPRSTHRRSPRETRWPKGRTQEISRLIGRSLRMAVDLELLGERQLIVDCDVLQADGGTRTAAITGGWLAVVLALQERIAGGQLPAEVLRRQVAAVSVGVVRGRPLLDLAYDEDVTAESDMNVVMTATGEIVEIQGTAEQSPFSHSALLGLLDLAQAGILELASLQTAVLQQNGVHL